MKLSHPEKFDIELAERVHTKLSNEPHLHHQLDYSYCVAGWTIRIAQGDADLLRRPGLETGDGARHLLGITRREARILFSEFGPPIKRLARWRLSSFIRQAKKYRAAEEARQREIDATAHKQRAVCYYHRDGEPVLEREHGGALTVLADDQEYWHWGPAWQHYERDSDDQPWRRIQKSDLHATQSGT